MILVPRNVVFSRNTYGFPLPFLESRPQLSYNSGNQPKDPMVQDSMPATRNLDELSTEVQEEIKSLAVRVTQGFPAFRSLKAILTDREWRQIESDLERDLRARDDLIEKKRTAARKKEVATSVRAGDPLRSKSAAATPGYDRRTPKSNPSPLAASGSLAVESKATSAPVPLAQSAKPAIVAPAHPQYYAIKTLMKLRKLSQCRAILELALANELLSDAGYRRLLREIGEGEPEPRPTKRPSWDVTTGTLRFENTALRTFKSQSRAKNQVAILEAFERHNWTPRVPNPLDRGQQSYDTVLSLNRRLKKIIFHVEDDGRQITWARR